MLHRLILVLTLTSIVATARQNTVPQGTRILHGEVIFPDSATISEAQSAAQDASFRRVVTDHPYSAVQTMEYSPLTEPENLKHTQKASLYRDTDGRTRADVWLIAEADRDGDLPPDFVEIIDPVGGFRYVLHPISRKASRSAWPPAERKASGQPSAEQHHRRAEGDAPTTSVLNESLGIKNLQGLMTEGTRTSITYFANSTGPQQPVTVTSEHWTFPEMKLNLAGDNFDPRHGKSRVRMTNLIQMEPDSALFQVPPDYQISDAPKPEPHPVP